MYKILKLSLICMIAATISVTSAHAELSNAEIKRLDEIQRKEFYAKHIRPTVGYCLSATTNKGLNQNAIINAGYKKRGRGFSKGFKLHLAGNEHPPLFNNRNISISYNTRKSFCSVKFGSNIYYINKVIQFVKTDIRKLGYKGGTPHKVRNRSGLLYKKGNHTVFITGSTRTGKSNYTEILFYSQN